MAERSCLIVSLSQDDITCECTMLQDLHPAMKMLGLNPSEQEVVDIPNNIAK